MSRGAQGGRVPTINIIGCGRAAGTLARLWVHNGGFRVGGVLNRSPRSTGRAVAELGAGDALEAASDFRPADFWLIGTSDDQILPATVNLAGSGVSLEGSVLFHLCGRHGLDVLGAARGQGAHTAAVHPVRSLTHRKMTREAFEGTVCVAEGPEAVLVALERLFTTIGGHWMPVRNLDRGLYHASVSIISNITKAVAWKAQNWLVNAGLTGEMAAEVAQTLLSSTVEDVARTGAKKSITGPVVRGDTRTIEAHIGAIQRSYPNDLEVYRVLARTVLELATERGDLDPKTLQRFHELLGERGQD